MVAQRLTCLKFTTLAEDKLCAQLLRLKASASSAGLAEEFSCCLDDPR